MKTLFYSIIFLSLFASCKEDCPDPPVEQPDPAIWNINDVRYINGEIYEDANYLHDFDVSQKDLTGTVEIRENGVFVIEFKSTQVVTEYPGSGPVETESELDELEVGKHSKVGNKFSVFSTGLYSGEYDIISETATTLVMSTPKVLLTNPDGSGIRYEFDLVLDLSK